ncbi:MAG: hydrogenase iron-sulfur subunit [Candidatus Hermodarchaeota archaeon]|nr:hydrogenase iron-sulfur subunit [Candidatus Hermodarchaeota archaeon]
MKIGVLLCNCGDTISTTLDYEALTSFIQTLPNVKYAETRGDWCQRESLQILTQTITKKKLDRLVIAACSPHLFGTRFYDAAEEAGMTRGQITFANIREHCAWVHKENPQGATAKAKRLIRSAVFRVAAQSPTTTKTFPVTQEVLVLGAGIAGIQAALDLADRGIKVHLVEKEPTIGGHMAVLNKTYPTLDCSICILGPKMAEAATHPNIELYPYTDLVDAENLGKDWLLTLNKKATYVDWDKCTGCMQCTEKCPTRVDDEWSWNIAKRRAIYMPFSQSVPRKVTIDAEHCKMLTDGKCGVCAKICPAEAIDYEMKDEIIKVEVGCVILATGFKEFDPSVVPELHFEENPDVITQMQFIRMMDSVGPFGGKLEVPSDGRKPEKIVMLQCVGSRDERYSWQCSSYCCMAAIKHAELAKLEYDPNIDITIVARDIRAGGKGFEEFYVRARDEYNIKVVYRGDDLEIVQKNGKLVVRYSDPDGSTKSLAADLVVLSCAMTPSPGTQELANLFGVPLGSLGFYKALDEKVALSRTDVNSVYLAGTCHGPKDIPESVELAGAAAEQASVWLSTQTVSKDLDTAIVNTDLCNSCGLCISACPSQAISLDKKNECVIVDEVRCQGCGECMAICPVGAIGPLNTNPTVLDSALEGLLSNSIEGSDSVIVGFACNECVYRAIDEAGEERLQYPADLHILEVPCTGSVSTPKVLQTIEDGATGVILFACDSKLCHYGRGARMANSRAQVVRNVLTQSGKDPNLVQVAQLIGRDAKEFAAIAQKAVASIQRSNRS